MNRVLNAKPSFIASLSDDERSALAGNDSMELSVIFKYLKHVSEVFTGKLLNTDTNSQINDLMKRGLSTQEAFFTYAYFVSEFNKQIKEIESLREKAKVFIDLHKQS